MFWLGDIGLAMLEFNGKKGRDACIRRHDGLLALLGRLVIELGVDLPLSLPPNVSSLFGEYIWAEGETLASLGELVIVGEMPASRKRSG
jgi:uncharacterized membrane protein YczE